VYRQKAESTIHPAVAFAWYWSLPPSRSAKTSDRKMQFVLGRCNFPGSTPDKHVKRALVTPKHWSR
jgi:hypothetical protein